MIELNKIRSVKTLEVMKRDLAEFVSFDRNVMVEVYDEECGWGEEDYEADLEQVKDLLEQVERRHKSLSGHLAKQKAKGSGNKNVAPQQSGENVSEASEQSA